MRVDGRGGRHRHATAAPVAPTPPKGSICTDHGPGPCPPWLPRFCVEHGHGPCPPPAPEVTGPSNWAAPEPMEVEPAPTPSFTVAGLRRARSRSTPTTAACRSALTRLPALARGEVSSSRALDDALPPSPLPTAPIPRRVLAGEAANRRPSLRRTWLLVPHGPSARGLPNGHAGSSENGGAGHLSSDEVEGGAP
ncbi:uncharacterized protein [Miscanthus floridulus]|uniref:uncharacterized protein n=1 Tax=Miscanthus floridulus TaxID=154761 RepID=UPI00345774CA